MWVKSEFEFNFPSASFVFFHLLFIFTRITHYLPPASYLSLRPFPPSLPFRHFWPQPFSCFSAMHFTFLQLFQRFPASSVSLGCLHPSVFFSPSVTHRASFLWNPILSLFLNLLSHFAPTLSHRSARAHTTHSSLMSTPSCLPKHETPHSWIYSQSIQRN